MTRDKDNVSNSPNRNNFHDSCKRENFNRVNDVTNDVKDKILEYSLFR